MPREGWSLAGGAIPRRVACAGGCVRWRARRYRFEVVLVDRSFDCRRRQRRTIPGFLGESSQERGSGLQEEIACVGSRGHRVAARLRGDLWSRRRPSLWASGFILSAEGAPDRRSLLRGRVRGGVGPGISRLSSRRGVGCDRGRQRSFAYLPRAENAVERGTARWRALVAREGRSWRGASNALAT